MKKIKSKTKKNPVPENLNKLQFNNLEDDGNNLVINIVENDILIGQIKYKNHRQLDEIQEILNDGWIIEIDNKLYLIQD